MQKKENIALLIKAGKKIEEEERESAGEENNS